MNREQYRAQVDALSFSSDFQDRTMARLAQEKERKPMKKIMLFLQLLWCSFGHSDNSITLAS